jgi:hypothetical protein
MKRKSLADAVSPEARTFIEAGTPKPQFTQTQEEGRGESLAVETPEPDDPTPTPNTDNPHRGSTLVSFMRDDGFVQQPMSESPLPVLIPQTFRLPQRIVDDLARAAIERKLQRRKPWSQQDIAAEAIKEWLCKHANK